MLPLPVILESQDDMSVVDGATIEPRIRINRPDDENPRCRVSSARGQPKDFSQLTQPPTTLSTSNVISLLQGRTELTRPIGVKPEGSKVDRMAAQSAKIEAGHVYLPKSAAWLGEFLTELLSFPNGRHDDQVDSVSQFLRWLQDAYLNQISFHVPFVVSRPREFLPP